MKSLRLDVFSTRIVATDDRAEWARFARRHGLEQIPDGAAGFTCLTVTESSGVIIGIWIDPTNPDLAQVMVHEAVHAAQFCLQAIGETEATHEVLAYLVGHVASWLARVL